MCVHAPILYRWTRASCYLLQALLLPASALPPSHLRPTFPPTTAFLTDTPRCTPSCAHLHTYTRLHTHTHSAQHCLGSTPLLHFPAAHFHFLPAPAPHTWDTPVTFLPFHTPHTSSFSYLLAPHAIHTAVGALHSCHLHWLVHLSSHCPPGRYSPMPRCCRDSCLHYATRKQPAYPTPPSACNRPLTCR